MNTLIKHITLIDGTGRPPLEDAAVAIRDGRIAYAGPASAWTGSDEAITLDLPGHFVLPGLIDAHVHLAGSG